jgi:hypothetical protein
MIRQVEILRSKFLRSTWVLLIKVDRNCLDHFCRLLVFDFCRPKWRRQFLSALLANNHVDLNVLDTFCQPSHWLKWPTINHLSNLKFSTLIPFPDQTNQKWYDYIGLDKMVKEEKSIHHEKSQNRKLIFNLFFRFPLIQFLSWQRLITWSNLKPLAKTRLWQVPNSNWFRPYIWQFDQQFSRGGANNIFLCFVKSLKTGTF